MDTSTSHIAGDEEEDVEVIRVDSPLNHTASPITTSLPPRSDADAGDGRPYSQEKLDPLRLSVQTINSPGRFIGDFFDILNVGVNGGSYIPSDLIVTIIRAALYWRNEQHCLRLFQLLQQDLRLRKTVKFRHFKELLAMCLDAVEDCMKPVPSSSSPPLLPSLRAVELALQYVISVLQKDLIQHCMEQGKELERKTLVERIKWTTLERTIQVLFSLVHSQLSERGPTQQLDGLVRELMTVLCLPLHLPSHHTTPQCLELMQKVAMNFSLLLSKVPSLAMRQLLLRKLPSVYLRQIVIDYHLEMEFTLHSSAAHFHNTVSYRNSEMSLNKFCCVHLCRVPYRHSGELHSPAFFLFLLCTLLQSHLKLLMGFPMVFQPVSYHTPSQPATHLNEELSVCLLSIKPHIERLVDRLSEDENLLATITEQDCWMYLQLLVKMTDLSSLS